MFDLHFITEKMKIWSQKLLRKARVGGKIFKNPTKYKNTNTFDGRLEKSRNILQYFSKINKTCHPDE